LLLGDDVDLRLERRYARALARRAMNLSPSLCHPPLIQPYSHRRVRLQGFVRPNLRKSTSTRSFAAAVSSTTATSLRAASRERGLRAS